MPAIDTELLLRQASIEPTTFDSTNRTIQVTFTTGAPVARFDWEGRYNEVLEVSEAAVDLSEIRGAPVLNSHDRFDARSILGVVENASITDGRGVATVRFSSAPDVEPVLHRVREGTLRSVSVGYSILERRTDRDVNGTRTVTATRWKPHELSFVAVPADPLARVRGATSSAPDEIRPMCAGLGLSSTFAEGLIARNLSIEQARADAISELSRRSPAIDGRARVTRESAPGDLARNMGRALAARYNPDLTPDEQARPYVHERFPALCRKLLEQGGTSSTGMAEGTLVRHAMTTSDFPVLLGEMMNVTLMGAYRAADRGILRVAKRVTSPDFRDIHSVWVAETPRLEKIVEEGEITFGSLTEGAEKFRLARFGKGLSISYVLLVNDSLGAVAETARNWGRAVNELEASEVVAVLTANSGLGPVMSDTKKLFDATHGNVSATGAPPSETTLDAGRLAMRKQKSKGGYPLGIGPKFLVVPPELETLAKKLTTEVDATETAAVNPFTDLEVITDVRLTNTKRWYLFAPPEAAPVLVYAFLEGESGPRIESQVDFHTDSTQTKCTMSYGSGVVDFLGAYTNAGV